MRRWGIVLNGQLLFATDDRDVAKRFLAMDFDVFDHAHACYTCLAHRKVDARDLMTEEDYLNFWQTPS